MSTLCHLAAILNFISHNRVSGVRALSYQHESAINSLSIQFISQFKDEYTFGSHLGRHLDFPKMLNNDRVASVGCSTENILAQRISKEKKKTTLNTVSRSSCLSAGL